MTVVGRGKSFTDQNIDPSVKEEAEAPQVQMVWLAVEGEGEEEEWDYTSQSAISVLTRQPEITFTGRWPTQIYGNISKCALQNRSRIQPKISTSSVPLK